MSEESKHLSFDIIEEPVTILKKEYVLRELDGPSSIEYRNFLLENIEKDEEGNLTAFHNFLESEQLLVRLGTFHKDGQRVDADLVASWPRRIVDVLSKRLKTISEMDGGESPNLMRSDESTSTETGSP